ncbi:testis-expressed protein 264 [Syngnathoides biaculeatus]|uniref:testis-expressed protein 264 n=1 Tax=Syngnathoides biaculeatus TaxID=300417 RepID=UPI002ADD4E08|nr:testis-expressed protein 264 [Syngnathoides biaculeatus]
MSEFLLLLLIVVLLLCLLVTLGGYLIYSGLLTDVDVRAGPPPIKNVTLAYKFKEGAYKECGAAFTETCSIGPKQRTIAIFYDDPEQRPAEKCRYIVGSVLSEGEEKPDEALQTLYEKFGFKLFSLPEVNHAVTTSFPSTTSLSYILAPFRVYPRLKSYIEERKLTNLPNIEICDSLVTNYMVPLSRQTEFFVPEMRDEAKADVKEEDSDEDRGTDITGADSHSDASSGSGGVPWDSRETSLAASTAASLASSLPLRDVMDAQGDARQREGSERGSDGSLASGSSFEELDMYQEEQAGKEEEQEEEEGEEVPEAGDRKSGEILQGEEADKENLGDDGEE